MSLGTRDRDDTRNRVNKQIRVPQVRLIDQDGQQVGIVDTREALEIAQKAGLDLVEIQPGAKPPVAKIMNHGKHLFLKKKQKAATKKKTKRTKLKEIKFRPSTDENDYGVKLRNLRGFLENGDKVKVTVWFRGREMAHQDLGVKLLERIKADLTDEAKVEFFPKLEGKQLIMILAPTGSKVKNVNTNAE